MSPNRRTGLANPRWFGVFALAVVALSLVAAACGSDSDSSSSAGASGGGALAELKKKGVVRIPATDAPPVIFDTKTPKGFLSEQAVMVFKKMGIPKVETVSMQFGAIIPSIQSGKIDVGLGFYFTKERCNAIAYTDPELYFLDAFMVQKGNPLNISTNESIAKAGAKVGLVSGAATTTLFREAGVKSSKIQEYPDLPTELDALKAKRIDVASWDNVSLSYLASQPAYSDLEVTEPTAPIVDGKPTPYAAAAGFAKDKADVAAEFSKVMDEMWAAGDFDALAEKYEIQKPSWVTTQPKGPTVAERCAAAK